MSAPGLKITNFHYTDVKFEQPKEFVEWPKWVHHPAHKSQLAENAEEEAAIRREWNDLVSIPATPIQALMNTAMENIHPSPLDTEREVLIQVAQEKNIKIDKRWSNERIKETIAKATEGL